MSIFYKSERVGKDGKIFKMYKFRTMREGADKENIWSTSDDDSRITRIGRFLRKWKLDELPQIINILKGEMAVIGPRPEVPYFVNKMTDEEQEVILSVKPGVVDLASVWDFNEGEILRGSIDPDKDYEEKIWPEKKRLQMFGIKTKCFRNDIITIWRTLKKILVG